MGTAGIDLGGASDLPRLDVVLSGCLRVAPDLKALSFDNATRCDFKIVIPGYLLIINNNVVFLVWLAAL